ncbi:MAG: adenylosuccinate synthase [Candidatus Omnitrophica bacterium]|nr:adenylosuccinate synthase [Candidatus Omnitrophota bacterium]MDD5610610.1 adenylosuccinate synthase [Candidatus Omnitrophota bacterium]
MNIVIVGAQWGDEGKGKAIDVFSGDSDYIVRYQGGSNAGHTVVVGDQEYIFHLIPSGILRRGKICVIGNGVVVDPETLIKEIRDLNSRRVDIDERLKISELCHVIMPYHRILDKLRESRRFNKIGTTGRGIGPCYADKINRCGIRMVDILNPRVLKEKLKDNLKEKNEIFKKVYRHPGFSFTELYAQYLGYAKSLKKYISDTTLLVNKAVKEKKPILFEGAQGTFLDIDFGTYPYVTSSSAIAAGACIGTGVFPGVVDKVIGVAKAYTTRVGEGPFPTEFESSFQTVIRNKGKEFGATTGRPRRCGWFDSLMVKHACMINGITEMAIMKLDVLDGLDKIKVCTAYKYKGKIFKEYPYDIEVLENAKPVYKDFSGWNETTTKTKSYDKLPAAARVYIEWLQDTLNVKVCLVSIGSHRDETLFL